MPSDAHGVEWGSGTSANGSIPLIGTLVLEGRCGGFVAILEGKQAALDLGEVAEVVRMRIFRCTTEK